MQQLLRQFCRQRRARAGREGDLEWLVRLYNECIAGRASFFHALHHNHKSVCGRLRADVDAGVLTLEQVFHKCSLACKQRVRSRAGGNKAIASSMREEE